MKRFLDLFYDESVYLLKVDIEIMNTFLMLSFLYNKEMASLFLLQIYRCIDVSLKCVNLYLMVFIARNNFPCHSLHARSIASTCLNMFDSAIEITRFCEI